MVFSYSCFFFFNASLLPSYLSTAYYLHYVRSWHDVYISLLPNPPSLPFYISLYFPPPVFPQATGPPTDWLLWINLNKYILSQSPSLNFSLEIQLISLVLRDRLHPSSASGVFSILLPKVNSRNKSIVLVLFGLLVIFGRFDLWFFSS